MDIVTLDFETYYDQNYSLSKLTTEEYIRDQRFEVIGVSAKLNTGPVSWFTGPLDDTIDWLYRKYPIKKSALLCHNTIFDGAILAWRMGIYPAMYLDTLSMARPIHGEDVGGSLKKLVEYYGLGAKGTEVLQAIGKRRKDFGPMEIIQYGDYCKNDTELTWKLFHKLLPLLPRHELKLIDSTIRMFAQPRLVLDQDILQTHLSSVREKKGLQLRKFSALLRLRELRKMAQVEEKKLNALHSKVLAGDEAYITLLCDKEDGHIKDALMSNPKFAELLAEFGVDIPMKISLTTGKEAYAFAKTDKGLQDLREHPDPTVQALVEARLGNKTTIEETRTERMIGIAKRGVFPVPLKYSGAITTMRWSGTDKINPQNFSRGGQIRKAIKTFPGHKIVAGDSSNIELRINHTLAYREASIEAFRRAADLYIEFASTVFERPVTKADIAERFLGKTAQLGLGYGCAWAKFKEMVRIQSTEMWRKGIIPEPIYLSDTEAKRIVDLWRKEHKQVVDMWWAADSAIKAMYEGRRVVVGGVPNREIVWTYKDGDECGFEFVTGHKIRYKDLKFQDGEWTYKTRTGRAKIYGGKAVENIVQSLARHVLAEQWVVLEANLAKKFPQWAVVMQVHDELVLAGPDKDVPDVTKLLERVLSTSPSWFPELVLACEVHSGESYGDAK